MPAAIWTRRCAICWRRSANDRPGRPAPSCASTAPAASPRRWRAMDRATWAPGAPVAGGRASPASLRPAPAVIVDLRARRVMSDHSPIPALVDDDNWRAAIADDLGAQFLEIAAREAGRHRFDTQELALRIDGRSL